MTMEYIRKAYGVPAKRGGRIIYEDSRGCKFQGVIRSATNSGHLVCSVPGLGRLCRLHPTWNIKYL